METTVDISEEQFSDVLDFVQQKYFVNGAYYSPALKNVKHLPQTAVIAHVDIFEAYKDWKTKPRKDTNKKRSAITADR